MIPAFLPIYLRRTRRCGRCGYPYPKAKPECPHCTGLSDTELEGLHERMSRARDSARRLGQLFLYLAALLALGVLALVL